MSDTMQPPGKPIESLQPKPLILEQPAVLPEQIKIRLPEDSPEEEKEN